MKCKASISLHLMLVHTQLIGHNELHMTGSKSDGLLPIDATYTVDIVCRHPKVAQYLVTRLKKFMDDPSIDAQVSKILQEENQGLTPGNGWIEEEYSHRLVTGE